MAEHRREDGLPVPLELPTEQLEGGVILLGHPFSGLVNKQGLQKPFRPGSFRRTENKNISLDNGVSIAL